MLAAMTTSDAANRPPARLVPVCVYKVNQPLANLPASVFEAVSQASFGT